MTEPRYLVADLLGFATRLFERAGMDADKAAIVAELLLEADLLGHTTHGLALAAPYLGEVKNGDMLATGQPEVVRDKAACLTWNGRRLPGVWLAAKAVDEAADRAEQFGMGSVAIRESHHIGCLAVFLARATSRGLMVVLTCSDPAGASIAPYGGTKAVFTPDPIAIGIPTPGDPILIDTSASITTNGMSNRLKAEGRRFPHNWLIDARGQPSDDPAVLFDEPPGTILPTGGLDHGHKGYALHLLVESLSQGLSGFGRLQKPTGWGASVFVQVFDPEAFAGADAFTAQTGHIAELCRASPPRPGLPPVRLPGEAGLARKARALAEGVELYPGIMPALQDWAGRLGVESPRPAG